MSFIGWFFLLVLALGFAELYLLVKVSATITFGVTLALCVLTGVIGGTLVRRQGLRTLGEIQRSMSEGKVPAEAIVAGLVLLIVGIVLIMPGFITDIVGFLLLVPVVRHRASSWLVERFKGRVQVMGPNVGFQSQDMDRENLRGKVIDVDPDPDPDPPDSEESRMP